MSDPRQGRYAVAGFDNDAEVERVAREFQRAVKEGDAKAVAEGISYPIDVQVNGKRVTIASRAEFVKHFDGIFDRRFRQAVCDAVPHAMFAKWSGVMLGDTGEIWLAPRVADARVMVIAINNEGLGAQTRPVEHKGASRDR